MQVQFSSNRDTNFQLTIDVGFIVIKNIQIVAISWAYQANELM